MVNSNVTTLTLTGSEQKVRFALPYPYYWIHNMGDSDVYVSMDEGISAEADGVITVPPGSAACTMHGCTYDTVYVSGTGKIQIMGTYSAFNPFKFASGGGENGNNKIYVQTQFADNFKLI